MRTHGYCEPAMEEHHWTRISDQYIQNMQFVNADIGVGSEVDVNSNRGVYSPKLPSGGLTWKTSSLLACDS